MINITPRPCHENLLHVLFHEFYTSSCQEWIPYLWRPWDQGVNGTIASKLDKEYLSMQEHSYVI